MTREQDKDSEFDAYLQGKSALSDSYADLPPPRLPDHLDAAILAEAHRAVNARPGAKPRRSWVVPVSMAASLFVVVMIGVQWRYLAPVESPAEAAREDRVDKFAQVLEEPKAVPGKEPLPMKEAARDKRAAAPAQAEEKTAHEPARMMAAAPAPVVAPEPAPMASVAAEKDVDALHKQVQDHAPAGSFGMMANKPMEAGKGAPAAEAPAALAEKQESMQAATRSSGAGMEVKKKARAEEEASNYAAQPKALAGAIIVPVSAVAPSAPEVAAKADVANLRPEEWIARIRQLKQQGKLDVAKKELAAFKKRYPAYVVPKDIEFR
jgi:hypothetical protein